jgi:hypothetical protein
MRPIIIASVLLVGSSMVAFGADAPNLVGSWTRTDVTMVLSKGKTSKPLFINGAADQLWKIKIEAQQKGSFSGTLTGSIPKSQTIVGAFQPDGKRFVFSTEHDSGSGEASAEEFQYCWTNPRPVAAGCATFKKDK